MFIFLSPSVPEEGKLYYVGTKKEEKREVVIEADRKRQIFLDCHFNHLGHHLGQKKTVHGIQSKYYWLGIIRDVVEWVRSVPPPPGDLLSLPGAEWSPLLFQIKVCETCQHAERNKNLARTVRPLKVEAPWDIVGIDFIGTLPSSVRGPFARCGNRPCVRPHRAVSREPARQHGRGGPHRLLQ